MPTILESLLYDPDRYLAAFDGDHVAFRSMTRDSFARSIFLDDRIAASDEITTRVPIEPLIAGVRALGAPALPLRFVFHVAHCGSTLLAHALDHPRRTLVLREPQALRQLGVLAAGEPPGAAAREWNILADLACRLLAKRYRADTAVIVKANVPVNFMVPWLLARQPQMPALFLHLPFDEYLVAILRSDDHRAWVLQVTGDLFPALAHVADYGDMLEPARMAAALWLVQMRIYADALTRYPATRSLDAGVLFTRPAETIAAAYALFGVPLSGAAADALVAGPLFTTNAKAPDRAYDEAERRRDRAATAHALRDEIAAARAWLSPKLAANPLPPALPRPLVGEERPLL